MHVYMTELDANGHIRFLSPSAKIVGLTGEPPRGFDGAQISYVPILPCMLISSIHPNIWIETTEELDAFRVKQDRSRSRAMTGSAART